MFDVRDIQHDQSVCAINQLRSHTGRMKKVKVKPGLCSCWFGIQFLIILNQIDISQTVFKPYSYIKRNLYFVLSVIIHFLTNFPSKFHKAKYSSVFFLVGD